MKLLTKGDRVYVVKPGYLAGDHVQIESVVFDRVEENSDVVLIDLPAKVR